MPVLPERRRKRRRLQEAGIVTWSGTAVPSLHGQPKFVPRASSGKRSISSRAPSPTSPMSIAFVVGSMENRQGFRSPYATISGLAPATATNGFPGTPCRRSPGDRFAFFPVTPKFRDCAERPSTPGETPVGTSVTRPVSPFREQDGNGPERATVKCSERFARSRPPSAARGHAESVDRPHVQRQTWHTLQHHQHDYGDRRAMDFG